MLTVSTISTPTADQSVELEKEVAAMAAVAAGEGDAEADGTTTRAEAAPKADASNKEPEDCARLCVAATTALAKAAGAAPPPAPRLLCSVLAMAPPLLPAETATAKSTRTPCEPAAGLAAAACSARSMPGAR